jgi:hypothetical protein
VSTARGVLLAVWAALRSERSSALTWHDRIRLMGKLNRTIAQELFGERRVPSGSSWKTHDPRD